MMFKQFKRTLLVMLTTVAFLIPASPVWAHGGVAVDFDTCRIPVSGHWVHFTAYTPTKTADTEFCGDIPDVALTNIVFDYESKALRKMTVEFEITKEPEGSVIYHADAQTLKSGTLNIPIDFNQHGAGDYLAHITLINEGTKVDAHAAFTVGSGAGTGISTSSMLMMSGAALVAIYLFWPGLREKVEGKKKEA